MTESEATLSFSDAQVYNTLDQNSDYVRMLSA